MLVFSQPALAESITNVSTLGDSTRIDASPSKWRGQASGATLGSHGYIFTGAKNYPDLNAAPTVLNLQPRTNSEFSDGNTIIQKSTTTNSWDSDAVGDRIFDPTKEDFVITFPVLETTGTIRQMTGLSSNPTINASYTSLDYSVYQVNNTFYLRMYENGTGVVPNIVSTSTPLLKGVSELGIRCESGVITYFLKNSTVITDIHTSTKKAILPLTAKVAFNRGSGQSGHSRVYATYNHYDTILVKAQSVNIFGQATDTVSAQDIQILAEVLNLELLDSSTYSNIILSKGISSSFPAQQDIDVTHFYSVNETQDTFNFTVTSNIT